MSDNTFLFLLCAMFFIMVIVLAGCASVPYNPCSMANMTASELEHALVHGCD